MTGLSSILKIKNFYDETLELHHKNYEDDLVELPQNKHRGSDYYKDWHK